MELPVQVNGKLRDRITVADDADEARFWRWRSGGESPTLGRRQGNSEETLRAEEAGQPGSGLIGSPLGPVITPIGPRTAARRNIEIWQLKSKRRWQLPITIVFATRCARGASEAGKVLETNAFFDAEDRTLLAEDKGLRLRTNHDLQSGAEKYIITFKGPRSLAPSRAGKNRSWRFPAPPTPRVFWSRLAIRSSRLLRSVAKPGSLAGARLSWTSCRSLANLSKSKDPVNRRSSRCANLSGLPSAPSSRPATSRCC